MVHLKLWTITPDENKEVDILISNMVTTCYRFTLILWRWNTNRTDKFFHAFSHSLTLTKFCILHVLSLTYQVWSHNGSQYIVPPGQKMMRFWFRDESERKTNGNFKTEENLWSFRSWFTVSKNQIPYCLKVISRVSKYWHYDVTIFHFLIDAGLYYLFILSKSQTAAFVSQLWLRIHTFYYSL